MKWKKLGLVYGPRGDAPWARSHAANPVAVPLEGDLHRVYLGTRDAENRTSITHVDVEVDETFRVVEAATEPDLGPGELGGFDDSGTSLGCVQPAGDALYLYYVGWNLGVTVPWRNSIGLAIGHGDFRRYSRAPIIDRSEVDPFSLSYPWVLRENGRYRMWYGSNLAWGRRHCDMGHVIKYAESDDGIHWERSGTVAIDLRSPDEFAVCRPCVLCEGGAYRMWFARRDPVYRLDYAESDDGLHWRRRTEALGIELSDSGWDSQMMTYPSVFVHRGRKYLLYNGNEYGREGFGAAVEDD